MVTIQEIEIAFIRYLEEFERIPIMSAEAILQRFLKNFTENPLPLQQIHFKLISFSSTTKRFEAQ